MIEKEEQGGRSAHLFQDESLSKGGIGGVYRMRLAISNKTIYIEYKKVH